MPSFSSTRRWSDHDYLNNVLFYYIVPISIGILTLFIGSIIYVCIKKHKRVPVWVSIIQVIGSFVLCQAFMQYASLPAVSQTLKREFTAVLEYKRFMESTLGQINRTFAIIGENVLLPGCACPEWIYQKDVEIIVKIVQNYFVDIQIFIQTMISAAEIETIYNIFDNFRDWATFSQNLIIVLFFIVVVLTVKSFIQPTSKQFNQNNYTKLACILFVSTPALILAISSLTAAVLVSDFCADPLKTVVKLSSNEDLIFYFNCTPNPSGGPYPSEFTTPLGSIPDFFIPLNAEMIQVSTSLESILNYAAEIVGMSYISCELANEYFKNVSCDNSAACRCDKNKFMNVTNDIGSQCRESGLFGVFQCGPPHERLKKLANTACNFIEPLVVFFFLFLGLCGHSIFLFYYQPDH